MIMTYKEAAEVLKRPDLNMKIWEDEIVLTSNHVEAIELALEALEKIQKIAPVGDVYPNWYDRLSNLDYDYQPIADKDPWYRAKDVWACIEPVSEEHREFGGKRE